MSKRKRNRRESGSDDNAINADSASQPKSHWRTLAPAASVIVIVLASIIWLNRESESVVSNVASSSVAQSDSETVNDNPPPVPTTGGPAIYYPEPSHDFGAISQGDKVSHTFIVQNYGDEPLKLIKAKGS